MAEDTRKRPDFSSDHSSNSAREPASDPLAELARLIGQNDPFNDISRRGAARKPFEGVRADDRPAPEWLARPASSQDDDTADQPAAPRASYQAPYREETHEPAAHYDAPPEHDYRPQAAARDFAPETRYAHDTHAAPDYSAHDQHTDPYQADDRYRVALPSGDHEGDGYYTEDGHLPPQGEEGPVRDKRRGGIVTIAAVLGLAVIGTAGAFGYRAFTSPGSSSSPPVIKADPAPAKTVPAAPAAAVDAQGKPFQDRIGGADTATRTAPREEQPVSLPVAPSQRTAAAPQSATAPLPSAQGAPQLVPPMPPASSTSEPKRVKTIPIRPTDGNAGDSAPTASTPGAQRAPAVKQPSGAAPMPIGAQPSEPSSRTKVATRSAPPAAAGSYVVQVSAQRTEAEAQSSYQALQAKYSSVLGGRNASIKRVDLGDKGGVFYRAQVGSFATSEQATAFCDSLKSAGGQCIVQRN